MADCQPACTSRPEFLPASLDHDSLPEHVRETLVTMVDPVYQGLVANAPTPAERLAGAQLVLLLTLEVIDQFTVAQATDFTTLRDETAQERQTREKRMRAHLRLAGRKLRVAKLLCRLQRLREQSWRTILGPVALMTADPNQEIIFSRNRPSDNQQCQPGGDPPCRQPQSSARAADSRSADGRGACNERCAQAPPCAGPRPLAAVSRHHAGPFPREKFFLQFRRFTEQSREPRAGPAAPTCQIRAGPPPYRPANLFAVRSPRPATARVSAGNARGDPARVRPRRIG